MKNQFETLFNKPFRVMWLLNHTVARKFEVAMLKKLGITEIFMPKIIPDTMGFRSASVDYSEDGHLTIPPSDLSLMNQTDWYDNPTPEAIEVANKHFDLAFFILFSPKIEILLRGFKGGLLLRAYGLNENYSYFKVLNILTKGKSLHLLRTLGRRFWFGQAYQQLEVCEPDFIKKRAVFLPLGMSESSIKESWTGSNKSIFFICPDIGYNSYYNNIFEDFTDNFGDFPYVIGGTQLIKPKDDKNILGFVSLEQHQKNMREMRLMFYHSQEPRHLHYHPLEAIQAGMPLIFMAGGLLDQLGGTSLPGRCSTIVEARSKIERILNDDWDFIKAVLREQPIILEQINQERCEASWRLSFEHIFKTLIKGHPIRPKLLATKRKKIAVILPVGYLGGTLRAAKLTAQALYQGSHQSNEPVDVVLFHLDDPLLYPDKLFKDLHPGVQRRPFQWKQLSPSQAKLAMNYAYYSDWEPAYATYCMPDDGINQGFDCDLWMVISDRLSYPLLPIKPVIHIVYDCIQRYVPAVLGGGTDLNYIDAVRQADKVLVTTEFTREDVLQYMGVATEKVYKVPMLLTLYKDLPSLSKTNRIAYFIWTANTAPHKNIQVALEALSIYYSKMNGQLACSVTGVNTEKIFKTYVHEGSENKKLVNHLDWCENIFFAGELPEENYIKTLAEAKFLWHPCLIDNGTGSVVEAASLGVPALSSDYPAMREMNRTFGLNLAWMNPKDPYDMAEQLKKMEDEYPERQKLLPSRAELAEHETAKVATAYWQVVRLCL